jgi:hypothetical protein
MYVQMTRFGGIGLGLLSKHFIIFRFFAEKRGIIYLNLKNY